MNDKNTILDRLSRREAQRLEKLHKAHKAREQLDASNENEEHFTKEFKQKAENIEFFMAQVPNLETSTLTSNFDNAKKEINELQKYVLASSLFLNEFNMRKHLAIVHDLQTRCYELEDRYVPRKKFGFTKKTLPKSDLQTPSCDVRDGATKTDHKWEENMFGFDSKQNECLTLDNDKIYQRDVTLKNLQNCIITLKGVLGSLLMTDLENCTVLCGPVNSSVFIEKCTGCKFVVPCQQLRMHTSTDCDIYLHVTSKGIVEDCVRIRTAPYNLKYDELDKYYNMSSLDRNINNWDRLDDFNWLNPIVPSPNWTVIEKEDRVQSWDDIWAKLQQSL